MMREIIFKGLRAYQFENDILRVVVIPDLGGKTASIYNKIEGFELLFQNKDSSYKCPEINSNFAEYDASGFDDAFPNIHAEKLFYDGKTINYPDHGEVWGTPMNTQSLTDNSLSLTCKGTALPYKYIKEITLNGSHVCYKYNIRNIGKYSYPCFWTLHCLVNCEDDMEIIFPSEVKRIINVQNSLNLGKTGDYHSYPIAENGYKLNRVRPQMENISEKYYVADKIQVGECGIIYPSRNVIYKLKYNAKDLPYLGFWVTSGGFRGDYNCAIEPSNGFYDSISIAKNNNALPFLKPGEEMNFKINICLESISKK